MKPYTHIEILTEKQSLFIFVDYVIDNKSVYISIGADDENFDDLIKFDIPEVQLVHYHRKYNIENHIKGVDLV
jgi:hypothetical protein